ncbi:MAG TPA: S41 family peptidase [Candidatus Limnocylindrales bacterium]|nr:S41 family peptidase [Candidatus Limnocylindrales bacterium]
MQASQLDPPDRQEVSYAPADAAVAPIRVAAIRSVRRARMPVITVAVTAIALLSGSALFLSGYSMGRQSAVEPGTPGDEGMAFQPFWDTYHTIEDRYAGGPVDREAVVQGAIRGMIDSLEDPYSSYLTSDQYRSSLQGISGQFEGIGAEIATQASDGTQGCSTLGPTCRLVIIAPMGGSPAEKAGLLPGDLVLATDGVPLDGLTVDAARERMRGPKDTRVQLSIQRGAASPFDLTVTRDIIQEREVESRELVEGRVGYLHLEGFSDQAAADFATALKTHVDAGRRMLIVDLRGNPGGYVTAARTVASQFMASGVVFWEEDSKGDAIGTEALPGGAATDPSIRVAVLIDRGTASASEIVAAALHDNGRATLVGQRSFGKGTVQQWQELAGEGGAFRLTVAKWLTPDKRWVHNIGIEPDVTVQVPATLGPGEDPVLAEALEVVGAGERHRVGGQ